MEQDRTELSGFIFVFQSVFVFKRNLEVWGFCRPLDCIKLAHLLLCFIPEMFDALFQWPMAGSS